MDDMNTFALKILQAWYSTPLSEEVLTQETAVLKSFWANCFGYYVLQLGVSSHLSRLSQETRLRNRFIATPEPIDKPSVLSDFSLLPFANESIDVVLVHHWLGLYDDPLAALAEISRVLIPGGCVVICGLRPLWLGEVWDKLWQRQQFPWSLRSPPVRKVNTWLQETGFTIGDTVHHSYGLSLRRQSTLSTQQAIFRGLKQLNQWGIPVGAGYVIFAQKQVTPLTPIKLKWSTQTSIFINARPTR